MAKLNKHGIQELAKKIVARNPGGIRYTQLVEQILAESPETPKNTVGGSIWNLETVFPKEIQKPSRGLYKTTATDGSDDQLAVSTTAEKVEEMHFYEPFGEWLKTDLDEVTDVAVLGGAGFKSKWGTPDVVGVYKPLASNLIKFSLEIVAAEIKIDPSAPVVAFGQAVAYRLFASKSYIVAPSNMTQEDQSRLEALCMLFGVGLVIFDVNLEKPDFRVRVRAQRFSPDMFYVNEFAQRMRDLDADKFEKLFR